MAVKGADRHTHLAGIRDNALAAISIACGQATGTAPALALRAGVESWDVDVVEPSVPLGADGVLAYC
jgi:hypothetical protein